ncbi:MAG TPA: hypothetical protein VIQ81_04115 [Gammaproteobacteria bacterium]
MPQLSNLTITGSLIAGYVVTVTTNVAMGTAYLVAVPAGEQAPSKVQIAAGQNYQGNAAVAQQTTVESTNITFPAITGLSSNTSYDVHCIHDASPVISGLIEGMDSTPMPSGIPRPAKGTVFTDPTYGTEIHRITDHVNDLTGTLPAWVRSEYSRWNPLNADESMFMFLATDGWIHIYDANTYQWIRKFTPTGEQTETLWHKTDPNLIYRLPPNGGLVMYTHNVLTDELITIADFANVAAIEGDPLLTDIRQVPGFENAARCRTKAEGRPSMDGRYWAFMVDAADFSGLGLMVYDLVANEITGTYVFATDGGGIGQPDHCSMSPSGEYIVASWYYPQDCSTRTGFQFYEPGGRGGLNNPCGAYAFSRDFTVGIALSEIGEHSDMVIDAAGYDWFVFIDFQQHSVQYDDNMVRSVRITPDAQGNQIYHNLVNFKSTVNGTAMHFSGASFNKPGWVLMSDYGSSAGWYNNSMWAMQVDVPNPAVYKLAHTQWAPGLGYFGEPHAAVNQDFSRIIWNTTWRSDQITDLEVFEIKINPADLVGNL